MLRTHLQHALFLQGYYLSQRRDKACLVSTLDLSLD